MPTVQTGDNTGAAVPLHPPYIEGGGEVVSALRRPRPRARRLARRAQPANRFRADIQGLRALAVGLVVVYHIWPSVLPGGFIGVDVFFVISGYLIVGSLVRELTSTGGIGLAAFYGRRIRRLLPAASAVLVATLAATLIIFPQGRWQSVAGDAAASSLNVQNWNQAFSTTSYAGATAAVSPLQHYWSLAVEEQFYLLVPVLLLGVAAAVRTLRLRTSMRAAAFAALCTVTGVSFIHSVLFSGSSPDLAYFFTTTRIWELGLGGILAVAVAGSVPSVSAAVLCGWTGMVLIAVPAAAFSTAMAFPGWIALLPTAGTALCLLAGSTPQAAAAPASAAWWQSLRPVTYLGDISYSLYLWHWPVTVFAVYLLGAAPDPGTGAAIAAGSILLAALSTRFIEKPFRRFQGSTRGPGRHGAAGTTFRPVYALAAAMVAVTLAATAVPYAVVQQKIDALSADYDSATHPGAMAFDAESPARVPPNQALRPEPAAAMADLPALEMACMGYDPAKTAYTDCVYGDTSAEKSIVLVGDSHAAHFMAPLDAAAKENGYRLYVLTRNGCPFNANPLHNDTFAYTNCSSQNAQTVQDILTIGPDLVVTSAMRPDSYAKALGWSWETPRHAVDGYMDVLEPLHQAGIRVGVIPDVPYPEFSVPECILETGRADECAVPRAEGLDQPDPLLEAAELMEGVRVVDLRRYFCTADSCPAVIGNVLAYRDNHITNTFARTLAQPLWAGLEL